MDYEGEALETVVTKRRHKRAPLKLLKKLIKAHGWVAEVVTDRLVAYRSVLGELGALEKLRSGRWLNNRVESSRLPFRRGE